MTTFKWIFGITIIAIVFILFAVNELIVQLSSMMGKKGATLWDDPKLVGIIILCVFLITIMGMLSGNNKK